MWLKLHTEGDKVRVSWGGVKGPYPQNYTIGRQSLERTSQAVKDRLQQLNDWYQNPNGVDLNAVLYGLARAGSDLHTELFSPLPDENGNRADLSALLKWYRRQRQTQTRPRLFVNASPFLHIPWALVYEGNPGPFPTRCNEDTLKAYFQHLWCMAFDLSTVFFGHAIPEEQLNRRADNFCLISALNRSLFTSTLSHLSTANDALGRDIETLLETPLGLTFSVDKCTSKIDEAASRDTIFHFFGHGRNGSLDLGAEQINETAYKNLMDRLTRRRDETGTDSFSLVILNACESVLGQGDYSLRAASARPGVCGVIAAEAEVPAQFALRFSYRFLDSVIRRRRSVGETMAELRNDYELWPGILLYGCYADPDYRFS